MNVNSSRTIGFYLLRTGALAVGALFLALALALPGPGGAASHASAVPKIISAQPTAREFSRARFSHPLVINNKWTPLVPGREFVLDGVVHEGKRVLRHRITSIVTDMKKVVDGIPCVVVWERDFSVGKLQESELFFVAQDNKKTVWLFGEFPAVYEGGRFKGAPETFIAPTFGTQPGIFMYQSPRVGKAYSQAYAPHVKFYDRARVLSKGPRNGRKICTPAGCFRNVLKIDEYAPYKPSDGHQHKFYAPGLGTILAKPAGEPNPETVSLVKVKHLDAGAMSAVRAGVLKTERLAYKTSDVYRQTPPMVRR